MEAVYTTIPALETAFANRKDREGQIFHSDRGVRIFYGLSGEPTDTFRFRVKGPPKKGSDLPYSIFTRRKKERFDFEGESGSRVYFCLRYENSKGGKEGEGPFGPVLSAIIP
jgi:hypothetical protein